MNGLSMLAKLLWLKRINSILQQTSCYAALLDRCDLVTGFVLDDYADSRPPIQADLGPLPSLHLRHPLARRGVFVHRLRGHHIQKACRDGVSCGIMLSRELLPL